MAWKHTKAYNKPARGASFMGWGGPAQGAGRGGPARPFSASSPTRRTIYFTAETPRENGRAMVEGDPEKMAERKLLAASKAAREEQLIQRLGDIALNSENEMAVISAANSALDRIVGKPEQVNKNLNAETTYEQLVRESLKPKAE